MAKKSKKKSAVINEPILLDPVLPLAAGFEIPPIKQGEAKSVFKDDRIFVVELPYSALYPLWEFAERRAHDEYPKYKETLPEVAQSRLDAVRAFRSAVAGVPIPVYSEKKAQKIRKAQAEEAARQAEQMKAARAAKAAKAKGEPEVQADGTIVVKSLETREDGTPVECPKCGPNRTILKRKSKKTGEKTWKCADCDFTWPRSKPKQAPARPSKASKASSTSKDTPKSKKAAEKPKKTGKKAKQKKT